MTPASKKPCAQCRKPVQPTTVSHLSGEEGGYRVALESIPVFVCAENHRRLISPEFASEVLDTIGKGELSQAYAAHRHGLFRRRTHCAKCGVEIDRSTPGTREFRTSMPLQSGASMQITVSAPWIRCGTCGTEQLPRLNDVPEHLLKALARAFRGAQIRAV
jgi:hypothetical protein